MILYRHINNLLLQKVFLVKEIADIINSAIRVVPEFPGKVTAFKSYNTVWHAIERLAAYKFARPIE